jgi:YgiT-type zinc finger domain-containing protein
MDEKAIHNCPRCQIGVLQRGQATFTAILNDDLLSVPDLTAWTCDICGYREFDAHALQHVELLTDMLLNNATIPRATARGATADSHDANSSQRVKP